MLHDLTLEVISSVSLLTESTSRSSSDFNLVINRNEESSLLRELPDLSSLKEGSGLIWCSECSRFLMEIPTSPFFASHSQLSDTFSSPLQQL